LSIFATRACPPMNPHRLSWVEVAAWCDAR
jgi:hypothetical protein